MPWHMYRSLRCDDVSFDTLRHGGPLSPRGGKSRLSNAVYRSLRCDDVAFDTLRQGEPLSPRGNQAG